MWIFDSDSFLPRSHCGPGWTSNLIFLSQLSNFTIFLSYLAIAFTLFYLWYRRHDDFPRSYILIFFSFFILFCGFTHFDDVLVFSWPVYRFFTLVDFITSLFSTITAIVFPYIIHHIVHLPSFQHLHDLTNELQSQMLRTNLVSAEYQHHNDLLKRKVQELEHEVLLGRSFRDNLIKLNELKSMLNEGDFSA